MALPNDFVEHEAVETNALLMARYKVGWGLITRWRRAAGLKVRVKLSPSPANFAHVCPTMTKRGLTLLYEVGETVITRWCEEAGVKPKRQANFVTVGPRQAPGPIRDTSLTGRAADHLRRFGPVYRCDDRGQPSPIGERWRRGNTILTDEELVGRAKRSAFDPDGWSALSLPTLLRASNHG